ncbi:collectin-12-like [Coregonus clupeaformis]|uniref:collectin-12-like n=1 Tax=Coregonus clupeaformis TaxID=59861 RepID=UPI001BDF9851|nr:collectin-12-like [Coregonus clupeaformis]
MPECSHSAHEASPWWSVDLLDVHRVTTVNITSRVDCCPDRMNGAEIHIGNSLENNGTINSRCGVIYHNLGGETHTFQCNETEGRYITVVIPGPNKFLILCEVEVYGIRADTTSPVPSTPPPSTSASKNPAATPPTSSSLSSSTSTPLSTTPPPTHPSPPPSGSFLIRGRNVTVVIKRLCWSDALFYCRDHYWDLLSVRSEDEQREVEDLLGGSRVPPLTPHLWLGLRRSLMADRWYWMTGDHMDFSHWERWAAPKQHSSPCGALASGGGFFWRDRTCHEHLNFLCYIGDDGAEQGVKRVDFYSTYRDKKP